MVPEAAGKVEMSCFNQIDSGRLKPVKVGFWADTKGGIEYLANVIFDRLPDPRDLVDPDWSLQERELIAAYLNAAPDVEHWLGYSYCRFDCGESGTAMGTTDKSDGRYLWPEGLSHYVLKHSVRLPEDFIRHIHAAAGNPSNPPARGS
jgi:hypothetical protein